MKTTFILSLALGLLLSNLDLRFDVETSFIYSFVFCFSIFVLVKINSFFKTRAKEQKQLNQKSVGDKYEEFVGEMYKNLGYEVEFRGLKLGKLDGGIDLIATNGREVILIQCKYWYKKASINHKMIKEFYGNCHFYMNKENFTNEQRKAVKCIYAIPSYKTLNYSAVATCKANYKVLRYEIIKAIIKP